MPELTKKNTIETAKFSGTRVREIFTSMISKTSEIASRITTKLALFSTITLLLQACNFGGNLNVNWEGNAYNNTVTPSPTATNTSTPYPTSTPSPTNTRIPVLPTPLEGTSPFYTVKGLYEGMVVLQGTINGTNGEPVCNTVHYSLRSGNNEYLTYNPNNNSWAKSGIINPEQTVTYEITEAQGAMKYLIMSRVAGFLLPEETLAMMKPLFPSDETFLGVMPGEDSLLNFTFLTKAGDVILRSQLSLQLAPVPDDPSARYSPKEDNLKLMCIVPQEEGLMIVPITNRVGIEGIIDMGKLEVEVTKND